MRPGTCGGWGEAGHRWTPEFGPAQFLLMVAVLVAAFIPLLPRLRGIPESRTFAKVSQERSVESVGANRPAPPAPGDAMSPAAAMAASLDPGRATAVDATGTAVLLLRGAEQQPDWVVPYGSEFWRALTMAGALDDTASPRGLLNDARGTGGAGSLADVLGRASRPIRTTADDEAPACHTRTYSATFDLDGFSIETPGDASLVAPPRLDVRTLAVRLGGRTLYDGRATAPARKLALCNTAQTLLNEKAGLVEHIEMRGDGVAVSWVLRNPQPRAGELVIEAGLRDATHAGVTSAGFHFAGPDGGRDFLLRHAQAVDACGRPLRVAMHAQTDGVTLRVPGYVMHRAGRPLVVESTVAPTPPFREGRPVPRLVPAAPAPVAAADDTPDTERPAVQRRPSLAGDSGRWFPPRGRTAEILLLLELRDRLVMLHGLAWNRIHEGIPYDRDIMAAQKASWEHLAERREAGAQEKLRAYQSRIRDLHTLLAYHQELGYDREARAIALALENFTILPFTPEGNTEANRLEANISARLPRLYRAMQLPGMDPYVIFTTLRDATRSAGMFHYYATATRATREGSVAGWSRRLEDYAANSNAYDAVRRPLFSRNTAVALRVAELGEAVDRSLECIALGGDTAAPFLAVDEQMTSLRNAFRAAPMAGTGDTTLPRHLARLRLAYSEWLASRFDFPAYTSPTFDGARVRTLLASVEAKLRNARDEASKQLVEPPASAWTLLGIGSRAEALEVLDGRRALTRRLDGWLEHVAGWRDGVERAPRNNFATLHLLAGFARNKAEWEHLLATEVYPVAWQLPPGTTGDLLVRQEFHHGAPVELSMNRILDDLQEIWTCYGEY